VAIGTKTVGEFGGKPVVEFSLRSDTGVEVDIMTYGVVVRDWRVPVAGGLRSVVLGFDAFAPYPAHSPYFGAVAGRVANRIAGPSFELDGVTYQLAENVPGLILHGGKEGLGTTNWTGEADSAANAVRFTHVSPDGHMGFPGNVQFTATYTLEGNRLKLKLEAKADRRTPINVVQHQYFNLGTGPDVLDHRYQIAASAYTPNNAQLVPTGEILPVGGTIWDFRQPRSMRDEKGEAVAYDGNLVLDTGRDAKAPAVTVSGPDGLLTLKLWTDQPGVQLYNSVWTNVDGGGRKYGRFSGFCLEDQAFPDAPHNPHFPSIIYGPERDYVHHSDIEIA
jgi:aldose 1-epimerase